MSGYLIIVMIILVLVVVVQLLCKVKFNSCRSIYTYNPKFTTKPPTKLETASKSRTASNFATEFTNNSHEQNYMIHNDVTVHAYTFSF